MRATCLALVALLAAPLALRAADANPWGGPHRASCLLVDLSRAYTDTYPDKDIVVSMEVVPRLQGSIALKFRFELAYVDGAWKPSAEGFTANVYDYHWPRPPRFSNIRIRGEALGTGLTWTEDGGLEGTLAWRFPKPFKELVNADARKYVPAKAWDLVPQEGEVRVRLPLNPVPETPRPTGLPPWWMPTVFGFNYYGTFTYEAAGETFTGEAELNLKPRPITGKFVPWTKIAVAEAEGGLRFTADLPERRVAAEAGGFAMYRFPEPVDASGFDGLRLVVTTDEPRADASVAVGLKEGTGAWFYSDEACPLTQKWNTWFLPFDRLVGAGFVIGRGAFDPNMAFDADAIAQLAIGAHNPFGVGTVRFTVESIELVRWTEGGYGAPDAGPVLVDVQPHTVVSRNGTDEVPVELMGVHMVGDVKPEAQSEAYFADLNIRHARPLQHTSFTPTKRVGVPQAKSLRHLGLDDQSVICYTWGNLWGRAPWMGGQDILPGVRAWGKALGESAWTPGDAENPLRRVEFWNEPFMWGRHINAYDPALKDPSQHGYIPGKLGAEWYAKCFVATRDAAKAVNPHVEIGGMSCPPFSGDAYSVFWDYVRHFIDACPEKIDFLTEHHYGGKPESYAASYEVVTAYCDAKHGRRIPIFNTECNDLVDTPTMGDEGLPAPWSPHADDLIRFRYNLRDIMAMIAHCPDKARGRAVHALWSGTFRKKGERHCFELLAPVAGKILLVTSSHPDVPAIACWKEGRGVLLAFNDSRKPKEVILSAARAELTDGVRVAFNESEGTQLVPVEAPPTGTPLTLAPYEAVRFVFEADAPETTRRLTQHFVPIHLADIEPGQSVRKRVLWRGDVTTRGVDGPALLQVVTSGAAPGEGVVEIGRYHEPSPAEGATEAPRRLWTPITEVPLPASDPGDPVIQTIPLPEAFNEMVLAFACPKDTGTENGYRVLMAAVWVEQRE